MNMLLDRTCDWKIHTTDKTKAQRMQACMTVMLVSDSHNTYTEVLHLTLKKQNHSCAGVSIGGGGGVFAGGGKSADKNS